MEGTKEPRSDKQPAFLRRRRIRAWKRGGGGSRVVVLMRGHALQMERRKKDSPLGIGPNILKGKWIGKRGKRERGWAVCVVGPWPIRGKKINFILWIQKGDY